jgi:hypothetical protein
MAERTNNMSCASDISGIYSKLLILCKKLHLKKPLGTFYPQKLALTLQTSGDCLVGIIRSRTQATE